MCFLKFIYPCTSNYQWLQFHIYVYLLLSWYMYLFIFVFCPIIYQWNVILLSNTAQKKAQSTHACHLLHKFVIILIRIYHRVLSWVQPPVPVHVKQSRQTRISPRKCPYAILSMLLACSNGLCNYMPSIICTEAWTWIFETLSEMLNPSPNLRSQAKVDKLFKWCDKDQNKMVEMKELKRYYKYIKEVCRAWTETRTWWISFDRRQQWSLHSSRMACCNFCPQSCH